MIYSIAMSEILKINDLRVEFRSRERGRVRYCRYAVSYASAAGAATLPRTSDPLPVILQSDSLHARHGAPRTHRIAAHEPPRTKVAGIPGGGSGTPERESGAIPAIR